MSRRDRASRERGMLSLEAVLVLPVLVLLMLGLLQVAVLVRDVLIVHEAARAGARVAATTTGANAPTRAVRAAAPELAGLAVTITPVNRRAGDLARVEVRATRRIAGVTHTLRARAVALVEPTGRGP